MTDAREGVHTEAMVGVPVPHPSSGPPFCRLRLMLDGYPTTDPVAQLPWDYINQHGILPVLIEALRGVADEFEKQLLSAPSEGSEMSDAGCCAVEIADDERWCENHKPMERTEDDNAT